MNRRSLLKVAALKVAALGLGVALLASPSPALAADPREALTVDALSSRSYDGGAIVSERVMARFPSFTRHLIRWRSDGLVQYGFANIPTGAKKRLPVVLLLHGYVNPATYQTTTYTTRYADALARAGYVVLHPNYRGHGLSEGKADGLFRVGYALDVLNLAASLRKQAGGKGFLSTADGSRVALWGHSMGGGVAHRVLTVRPAWFKAAVFYGAMSADERENSERIYNFYSNQTRGVTEYRTPEKWLELISPLAYLPRVTAKISVHHGAADESVPVAWSLRYCQIMKRLGKTISCNTYAGAPHLFARGSRTDALFKARVLSFLTSSL